MHFRKKLFKIIQKALRLSLVSDALSQNIKTFVLLTKTDGEMTCKFYVSKNDQNPLRKSIFSATQNRVAKTL